jgi:hypothetical protein
MPENFVYKQTCTLGWVELSEELNLWSYKKVFGSSKLNPKYF